MAETTKLLLDGLIAHYGKPDGSRQEGEVLLPEVAAPGSSRRCDLLRVGLWPSRGLGIDVHELKTSRSDWLRELNDPAKADAWWKHSSRFWVVAPPGLIDPREMPPGWGLMVPPSNGRRFKVVVKAETRTPELSLALMTELVSRTDNIRAQEIHQVKQDQRNAIYRAIEEDRRTRGQAALDINTKQSLDLLNDLEKALGCRIDSWGSRHDLDRVGVEELAEALREYTRDHVALQRRAKQLGDLDGRLRRASELALKYLNTGELR
ncbi:hypothetical protein OG589_14640 [Sphaerisporangium sp. NBC_01403]|uniref:hypothetical protein n=1 Tax=Sphaerisporangium sp. NBC_01403 TaxID=2903599 RepID=UPI00324870BD